MKILKYFFGVLILSLFIACSSSDPDPIDPNEDYVPTPKPLAVPPIFKRLLPPPNIPADNPQTVEGVALGRKLFFDPILSGDGTQACASCHQPSNSFSDTNRFSVGIDGLEGTRNSMPIYNMAWSTTDKFFWDGRANSIEEQALGPVENPVEMHNTWENAVASLQSHAAYPEMFNKAFGTSNITKELTAKAIAQFERTLISANSPFDKYLLGEGSLTPQELNGFQIFMDESRGDCFHCHGNDNSPLWTDNAFHNNGLDAIITDKGLGEVTGDPNHDGLFKSPSLRNLAFTAPYMHDGRFATLDEVINHYSEGLVYSRTIDPLMKAVSRGGVHLTESDKADLKAFLLSLSDSSFINNPDFQDPN
ncbi:cytochrome-c peroxidase [Aequorivita vladivostokensis]|uniref:cytochrome-c peroxidase n=1 Tax=Aequorivita vladivostokensis TaxID=171194 RepID=UPI000A073151|nr:cytochrome c peroxidase [Aequorivita vladivostokensis]MAB56726.1 cytochrome-c peroxidase [Aequorivita sp.]MAO47745.1 cytochrome-c peroxidase [Aequorivita sp.]MBF29882.1 cytochrome-c peroxidase [Aequorivita sp.]HBL79043.1 cytochrome-c peroxidase [Aequorivita sp.]|tara:strand:- start:67486 stop:68574 length:1089 start_codon:yes stop_codon:yes gene_type:complete